MATKLGSVHKETLSQNRGCHEFEKISLSEVTTIKSLIKYRCEFDKFYEAKLYEESHPYLSNGVPIFHELIEIIYIDLESLIKKSKMTNNQKWLVSKIMQGYTETDIAEIMNWNLNNVNIMFEKACQKIKEQNDLDWINWIETSGQIKTKYNYKQCSKCGEFLRATEEYFGKHPNTRDGLQSNCKNCDSLRKKPL